MAVLRGILLFVFFGALVWLAVFSGAEEGDPGDGRSDATLAADGDGRTELPELQAPAGPVDQEGAAAGPEFDGPDEGLARDAGRPSAASTPLEDDPYVIDVESAPGTSGTLGAPATSGEDRGDSPVDGVAILGFDDQPAAEDTDAPPPERELPEWLEDEPAGLAGVDEDALDDGEPGAEWAPIDLEGASRGDSGSAGPASDGQLGSVQLAPARSPSTQLADLVLQAVVTGDPGQLNEFLNQDQVGAPERNLVSAFWMAVTGDEAQGREWMRHLEAGDGVTELQLSLLREALDGGGVRAMEASFGKRDPLALAMTMVLLHQDAQACVRDGRFREACEALSDLVQSEVDAPWSSRDDRLQGWGELLNDCQDRHRLNPRGEWPAIEYEVQDGDTLIAIRKKVIDERRDLLLCTGMIEQTNDITGYLQRGMRLRIPTARPNVIVDLDSRVVLYRHGEEVVRVWVVGIGREGHETPTGDFVAGEKQREPAWMPVGGRQLPYGHPDNPLGTRWIEWYRADAGTSYGFHGTSDPGGVGDRVSQGCVRMHNEHVEELYDLLPIGAEIRVQS